MKIGMITSLESIRKDINALIKDVVEVENQGFDHYWFIHLPYVGFDALQMVSLAAQSTSRIELGTAVIPTYPRHPFVMAQQALTAQAAAKGRLTLGIGPSHDFVIEDLLGMEYDRPGKHTREYLTVLQQLNQTGKSNFTGEFYDVAIRLLVVGADPVSIMVAALGPVMLKVAGELADGTITWMTGTKTIETHIAPKITEAAESAGRPSPRIAITLPLMVTDDAVRGRERVNEILKDYGEMPNYRRMLDIEGVESPGDVALVGSRNQIEDKLNQYKELGVTDYCALIIPEKDSSTASIERSQEALMEMVGKIG